MRNVCAWLLTGAMLLSARSTYAADAYGAVSNAPRVCNDGSLLIGVAIAYQDTTYSLNDYGWLIQGWYYVAPGKCQAIGEARDYYLKNVFSKTYSRSLLAFAFKDSAGVWGAVRVPDTTDGIFTASNEQVCVAWDDFRRSHAGSRGGPGDDCASAGDMRIPASLEYTAESHYGNYGDPDTNTFDFLHVRVDSSQRAQPMRSQGSPSASSNAASAQSAPSGGDSFGDQVLKAIAQAIKDAGAKPTPNSDPAASEAQSKADLLRWVQEDVTEYIAASSTGFEAYKSGSGAPSSGNTVWDSKVKPLAAKGCWVVQGDTSATFSCLLSSGDDLNALRAYYMQLTDDVAASLPQDWKADAAQPFGGDLPSKAFRGTSGAHGEVWIGRGEPQGKYELHYQLVSAPLTSSPVRSPSQPADDPIGSGGFITPPNPSP
jgi:hypothetical protein